MFLRLPALNVKCDCLSFGRWSVCLVEGSFLTYTRYACILMFRSDTQSSYESCQQRRNVIAIAPGDTTRNTEHQIKFDELTQLWGEPTENNARLLPSRNWSEHLCETFQIQPRSNHPDVFPSLSLNGIAIGARSSYPHTERESAKCPAVSARYYAGRRIVPPGGFW